MGTRKFCQRAAGEEAGLRMGIPQILIIALYFLATRVALALHGKPKTGTYNFWKSLLVIVIIMSLLIWGGFFE